MILDNVKCLANERGVSLHQIEVDCKIGNGTLAAWGKENPEPRLSTVRKVAEYFNCTVDELVKGR